MGTLSLGQINHLFWLGRYMERVKTTLRVSGTVYDTLLDGTADVHRLCALLSIPDIYDGADDFIGRYMFDADDPNSVISNLNRAFDNAIVMRDLLQSGLLAYVQLAVDAMLAASRSQSPMLEEQEAIDYLYAFWGALDDYMPDVHARYTVRLGASVEQLDLALRLREPNEVAMAELERLRHRLSRSGVSYDAAALARIEALLADGEGQGRIDELLELVNALVRA